MTGHGFAGPALSGLRNAISGREDKMEEKSGLAFLSKMVDESGQPIPQGAETPQYKMEAVVMTLSNKDVRAYKSGDSEPVLRAADKGAKLLTAYSAKSQWPKKFVSCGYDCTDRNKIIPIGQRVKLEDCVDYIRRLFSHMDDAELAADEEVLSAFFGPGEKFISRAQRHLNNEVVWSDEGASEFELSSESDGSGCSSEEHTHTDTSDDESAGSNSSFVVADDESISVAGSGNSGGSNTSVSDGSDDFPRVSRESSDDDLESDLSYLAN